MRGSCGAAQARERERLSNTPRVFSLRGSQAPNVCSWFFFLQLKHPLLKHEENRASLVTGRKCSWDLACTRAQH